MKKIICALLIGIIVMCFAGCGTQKIPHVANNSSVEIDPEVDRITTLDFDFSEQVLYESENVRVTALSVLPYELGIQFKIENLSDQKLAVGEENTGLIINGLVIETITIPCEIEPHAEANMDVKVREELLRFSGIEKIQNVLLNWHVDTVESKYKTSPLESLHDMKIVSESLSDDFTQEFRSGDKVLYEHNGICITYIGKDTYEQYDTVDCMLFSVENNSDIDISLYADKVSASGEEYRSQTQQNNGYPPKTKGIMFVSAFSKDSSVPVQFNGSISLDLSLISLQPSVKAQESVHFETSI